MSYVDGYVLAVPRKNLAAYRKMAKQAGKIWMEHGALQYLECAGEDMKKHPFCASFPSTLKLKRGETAIFAFVIYKSRKHRDQVNKKVMSDPRLQDGCDPDKMPFDVKRMTYGGFETIVEY